MVTETAGEVCGDALRTSAGLTFISHGARLGVRTGGSEVLARVRNVLPFGSRIEVLADIDAQFSLRAGDTYELYLGPERISTADDLDSLLATLESELHFQVARLARTALFVHAGVIGWKGRALLLPGRSMSGKTSLVAALVRAGATYHSDEYAVVDESGYVHPYPRPLALRAPDGARANVPVESIGGSAGAKAIPAGLIVATRYVAAASFRPVPMSDARALLALMDNTLVARERPRLAMDTLARLAGGVAALCGERGEAEEAVPRLLESLEHEARVAPYARAGVQE